MCATLMLAAFDGARQWREANVIAKRLGDVYGGGLHSSTSQLNLSRVCHKKTTYTP